MLYWRALERFDWRTLLPIAVLTAFWVNYHNPLFGYVVFFGLFVDVGLRQLGERAPLTAWVRWGAWGLLLVALGFLRWEGQHFLLAWLNFAPEWRQEIGEYKAPLAYLGQKATYVWLLTALAAVALTLRQKRWGFLIVLSVFLYGALTMSRMIVPSMVVVLCILAVVATAAWQPVAAGQQPGTMRRVVTGASLLTSLAALFFGFSMALGFLYENRIRVDNVPVAAVDYLESERIEGNLFHNYRIGGYLLYRLGPEARVFIDGRTDILYPIDHFLTYKAALHSTERFLEQAERWDIETAILENSESSAHMMADAGFFLDFSGAQFSVYRRGGGRLQELGRLSLYPYCQARFAPEEIVAEVEDGMTRFHKFAMINSVLILANNYYLSDDKTAYLAAVNPDHLLTDPSKRLYAAYAMSHGMRQAAAALLERVDENVPRDFLARLYLMVQRGEDVAARELLRAELVTFADWRFVYERDLEILVLLLRHLDPDGSEALLPAEARSALETSTALPVQIRSVSDLEPEHFCASAPWS